MKYLILIAFIFIIPTVSIAEEKCKYIIYWYTPDSITLIDKFCVDTFMFRSNGIAFYGVGGMYTFISGTIKIEQQKQ